MKRDRHVSFAQSESASFKMRPAALDRRHSTDAAMSSDLGSVPGQGPTESERFHPYRRQFSDGAMTTAGCLPHCPTPTSYLQEESSHDTCSVTHKSSGKEPTSWDQCNGSFQASKLMRTYPELPAVPVEPACFLSESKTSYSLGALQQFSPSVFSSNGQSSSSQYSLHCLSHQDNSNLSLFPKPIYSYSILIFMALKNSKTGSLPVSEIYSFMTEHFPYFKTAPDGWKNSVRHNLSLNKCFEKVENKNGNSSRKGCLWALNPAKVEKMQEELHKWRRKDPVTVRKSMARPEDLDRLLGERPEKLKSSPGYHSPGSVARLAPTYKATMSSFAPPQHREHCLPMQQSQYPHVPTSSDQHCYLQSTVHHTHSFPFYSACRQQPLSGVPSTMASLGSSMARKMPPAYSATLRPEYSPCSRSMHELLLEGDGTYDVDTLNPSLTDLQLQGNLWEELRQDSLVPDSLVVVTTSPPSSSYVSHTHTPSPHLTASSSCTSEVFAIGLGRGDQEDEEGVGSGSSLNQHMSGLYPMELLTGYLTSCTTPIPLL